MRDHQMNRVWRRLWRAFLVAGGEIKDRRRVERFQRLAEDHLSVMPPSLSRAMAWVVACEGEVDYDRLVHDLRKGEGTRIGGTAAEQRVSRALRRLEEVIRTARWIRPAPPERVAIIFEPPSTLPVRRTWQ